MKIPAILYWFFIICFAIQVLFSRNWMSFGEKTLILALIPLLGASAVLFRKVTTEKILGKIVISVLLFPDV